jgi:hypothetical protein
MVVGFCVMGGKIALFGITISFPTKLVAYNIIYGGLLRGKNGVFINFVNGCCHNVIPQLFFTPVYL